jgi:hypothetical protein
MQAATGSYSFISRFNSNPYLETSRFFTSITPQKHSQKLLRIIVYSTMTQRLTKYSWMRYRLTKRNNKETTDTCEIWGTYSRVDEDPRLLGCYDMAWQPRQHGPSTATWLMHYEVLRRLVVGFPSALRVVPSRYDVERTNSIAYIL